MMMFSSRVKFVAICGLLASAVFAVDTRDAVAQTANQWQQLRAKPRPIVVPQRPVQQIQPRVPVPRREVVKKPEPRQPVARKTPVERPAPKRIDPPPQRVVTPPSPPTPAPRIVTPAPKVQTSPPPVNVPSNSILTKQVPPNSKGPAPVVPPAKPTIVTAPPPKSAVPTTPAAQQLEVLRQQRLNTQQQTLQQRNPVQPSLQSNASVLRKPSTDNAIIAANKIQAARQQRIAAMKNKAPPSLAPGGTKLNAGTTMAANPGGTVKPIQTQFVPKSAAIKTTSNQATPSIAVGFAASGTAANTFKGLPKGTIAKPVAGGGFAANAVTNRKLVTGTAMLAYSMPAPKIGGKGSYVIGPNSNPKAYSFYKGVLPPWAYKTTMPYWFGSTFFFVTITRILTGPDVGGYSFYYEAPDEVVSTMYKSSKSGAIFYSEDSDSGGAVSPVSSTSEPADGGGASPAPASSPPPTPPADAPSADTTPSASSPAPAAPEPATIINASSTATMGGLGGSVFEACAPNEQSATPRPDNPAAPAATPGDGTSAPAQLIVENGGHLAQIRSLLFTPGGKCLISAGDDKTIRIWSLLTGRSERVLRGEIEAGPKGIVRALALSPDGAMLAAGGSMDVPEQGAHAIRLYDLRTGEISGLLIGHVDDVTSLAFSPDGNYLLSGGLDRQAILWDVAARAPLQLFSGHEGAVISVAFSRDGQRVVTASHDRTGRLWDIADAHVIAELKGHEGPLTGLAVIGPEGFIITASQDGDMKLWSGSNGRFIRAAGHVEFVPGALAPAADGAAFVVTCAERCQRSFEQRVLSFANGKTLIGYRGHDGFVAAAAVNVDGLVATGGGNGHEIHLWKIAEAKTEQVLKGTGRSVSATGFYPDNLTFAWSYSFTERSHQMRGQMEFSIDLPGEANRLGQPLPVDADAAAGFMHAQTQAGDYTLEHGAASGNAEPGRGRGGGSGSGSGPGAAVIKIRRNDQVVANVDPSERLGKAFAYRTYGFLPSESYFVAGGDNGVLEAYDLKGAQAMNYVGHTSTVWSQTPSPDGRLMVSGGGDQTVKLWNLSTGELVVTLFHGSDGEWVMWTPQGYYTGSASGGALIGWHVNRGDANAADFVRGQQLRQYLNRPDIVERAITNVSASEAIRELAPNHVNLEELLTQGRPPTVVYFDGQHEATGGRSVVVVGVRENPMPTESFDVWVRDRKVTSTKTELPATLKREPGIEYTALEIPLYSGENDVRIVVNNEIGSSDASDKAFAIRIVHNGEGALDKRGTLHILAVGVDKYPGLTRKCAGPDGICDLRFAGRDAVTFAATAESEMRAAHERVASRVLVNGRGAADEPSHANIAAALTDLKKNVKDNDTVALFFAGHGDNVGGSYYFLPTNVADAKGNEPGDNFLAWSELQQAISPVTGRKLLFLDSCRSGDSYNHQLGEEATASRYTAFTASTGQQLAEEDNELQHGQFTYAVINGLKGKAEDKSSRAVLVLGLANYVNVEVAKRTAGRQTPMYYTTTRDGNFPIVKH